MTNLESHPVFARFLAAVLEQAMELDVGRLTDVVEVMERGGDWKSANQYYDLVGV